MTKLKNPPSTLTADSKALSKLCQMRMSCRDTLHLWLKNKAHQMSWLSQHLPGMCSIKVSGSLGFMTSMLHHFIFIANFMTAVDNFTLRCHSTDSSGAVETFKLLCICSIGHQDPTCCFLQSFWAFHTSNNGENTFVTRPRHGSSGKIWWRLLLWCHIPHNATGFCQLDLI